MKLAATNANRLISAAPYVIATIAIVVLGIGMYMNRAKILSIITKTDGKQVVFSDDRMLLELWSTYKKNTLEPISLRTLDKSQGNITTSEGQSYTMMRAVWMDDIDTFDRTWQWTKDNLQREDNLMSWKFGELENGSYGIQTEVGGNNTATDGDTDIAFALLMAASRWKNAKYLYDARPILRSVWDKEVVIINSKPVLAANDIERLNIDSVIVNPSYLSPYAYKVFAKVDPARDWTGLVDNSYAILNASIDTNFVTTSNSSIKNPNKIAHKTPNNAGLTPNWVRINRATGIITPAHNLDSKLDSHYGYDAFRTPWRMALDWTWNKDIRAKQILAKHQFLGTQWNANKSLAAIYSHTGAIVSNDQAPAAYGANIAYFIVEQPKQAEQIYDTKLVTLYSPDTQSWKDQLSYYDDNWAWFGIALYQDSLPNLTENAFEQ